MPGQPSINRGTLILLDLNAKDSTISSKTPFFVFQFNPEKLVHTFNQAMPLATGTGTSEMQATQPAEFFNLSFELDCVDIDSSTQNQSIDDFGLHPSLAILELMMQPQLKDKQMVMPIVVFKWGAKRALAVHLVSMIVEEKSFDITLNPTRATVNVTLRVLSASEVNKNQGAQNVYLSHEHTRATLVDVYKLQTGQATAITDSDNIKLAGSVGAESSPRSISKQKISS